MFLLHVAKRILIASCMSMMVLAFAMSPSMAASRHVTDSLGRDVEIGASGRILTLGSDISEIVVALGEEKRIAGVDRGSSWPESLKALPNVGYRRALSAEGIAGMMPDLIMASEDVATPQAKDMLQSFGIPVVFVKIDNSLEGLRQKIAFIADVLDVRQEGEKLDRQVSADFEAAAALSRNIAMQDRKKVVFFHGLLRLTAAGEGTAADAIIRYAGGVNPVTFEGYKGLSEELLLGMAPDTVLMLPDNRGGPAPDEVFAIAALRNTPAGQNRSLMVLDGAYMINFGPRTAAAIRALAVTLYPEVQATAR